MTPRVQHKASKQKGVLLGKGLWYATVKFDGDYYPSMVSNLSIRKLR